MLWSARDRVLVDETLPDISLRFVRRAPDPGPVESEPEATPPDVEETAPAKD